MRARELPTLIETLLSPGVYPHEAPSIRLLETHISYVVLTGAFAYKLKKTIDLGFLDFSTLEKRRTACFEEVRLNRRLAPDTYVDVVALRGTEDNVAFATATPEGDPRDLEYAVRMREFPQESQLDRVIAASDEPAAPYLDDAAKRIAAFHAAAPRAGDDVPWGSPDAVAAPVRENFAQIEPRLRDSARLEQLATLRTWSEAETARLADLITARKRDGFARECHGDLHLTNLVLLDDGVTAFDCIEFDPGLRWIDVISDVAFLVMDLDARGQAGLGAAFLNAWLEETGDFAGLALLRYYLVYRALVRAKVAAITMRQSGDSADADRYRLHASQAERMTRSARPAIILMCGVSGSGKSWLARRLAAALPAIRVRSDVERKRLFDLGPLEDSRELCLDIYSSEADRQTQERLADVARMVARSGYPVILDATFRRRAARDRFRTLATELGAGFVILQCASDERTLIDRVAARTACGSDASEAGIDIVRQQLPSFEAPADDELPSTIVTRTRDDLDIAALAADVSRRIAATDA